MVRTPDESRCVNGIRFICDVSIGIEVPDFEAFATQIARSFGEIIRDEDYAMSASQQRSADTGALDQIVFGRNEPALHHYHNTYRSMLGQELLPLLDKITADR